MWCQNRSETRVIDVDTREKLVRGRLKMRHWKMEHKKCRAGKSETGI